MYSCIIQERYNQIRTLGEKLLFRLAIEAKKLTSKDLVSLKTGLNHRGSLPTRERRSANHGMHIQDRGSRRRSRRRKLHLPRALHPDSHGMPETGHGYYYQLRVTANYL